MDQIESLNVDIQLYNIYIYTYESVGKSTYRRTDKIHQWQKTSLRTVCLDNLLWTTRVQV